MFPTKILTSTLFTAENTAHVYILTSNVGSDVQNTIFKIVFYFENTK